MKLLPEAVPETENDNKVIGGMRWNDLKVKLDDPKFPVDAFINKLSPEEAELFQKLNQSSPE